MNSKTQTKNILIYPGHADPTQPYVALPTLKAYLKQHSVPCEVQDWNIEGLHYLFGQAKQTKEKHQKKLIELQSKKRKKLKEKLELLKLYETQKGPPLRWKNLVTTSTFYDWQCYQESHKSIEDYFEMLSALHHPYELGLEKCTPLYSPWDPEALRQYISPLETFYKKKIKNLAKNKIGFIGLSLTFVSQLAETFTICKLIKEECPEAFIVLGGAALHQIASHMNEEEQKFFFQYADALCTYEGEEALVELHRILPEYKKTKDKKLLGQVPNLLLQIDERIVQTEIKMFELKESPAPDYSDLNLKLYLAPTPILLYAPTRGCYWNKCSFCYYGFSQASTHCYREKSPEQAAKELIELSKKYKVKNFYISGDVLSPKFAVDLAKELKKKKAKIHWSTDLRIERYYTPERCRELYEGGLKAVAFGIESGSDEMLKHIINKGMTRETATKVNRNFYEAGIATAWMTFLHHPKETAEDAFATLNWIREQQDYISLFIVGEFGLTPGSKIYGEAKNFNLKKIYYTAGDFFKLYPLFEEKTKDSSAEYRAELAEEINEIATNFSLSHYPWAGAISTHHSLLYFLKYGQDFFKEVEPLFTPKKDLAPKKLREEVEGKISLFLEKALRPQKNKAPLSFDLLQKYLNEN